MVPERWGTNDVDSVTARVTSLRDGRLGAGKGAEQAQEPPREEAGPGGREDRHTVGVLES